MVNAGEPTVKQKVSMGYIKGKQWVSVFKKNGNRISGRQLYAGLRYVELLLTSKIAY